MRKDVVQEGPMTAPSQRAASSAQGAGCAAEPAGSVCPEMRASPPGPGLESCSPSPWGCRAGWGSRGGEMPEPGLWHLSLLGGVGGVGEKRGRRRPTFPARRGPGCSNSQHSLPPQQPFPHSLSSSPLPHPPAPPHTQCAAHADAGQAWGSASSLLCHQGLSRLGAASLRAPSLQGFSISPAPLPPCPPSPPLPCPSCPPPWCS